MEGLPPSGNRLVDTNAFWNVWATVIAFFRSVLLQLAATPVNAKVIEALHSRTLIVFLDRHGAMVKPRSGE